MSHFGVTTQPSPAPLTVMVDFPANFPYLRNSGFVTRFCATICQTGGAQCGHSLQVMGTSTAGAHLPHGALHAPQEIIIMCAHAGLPVAVVHLKAQLLHLLKVVIHREDLGEDGVQVALDDLAAVHLQGTGSQQPGASVWDPAWRGRDCTAISSSNSSAEPPESTSNKLGFAQ